MKSYDKIIGVMAFGGIFATPFIALAVGIEFLAIALIAWFFLLLIVYLVAKEREEKKNQAAEEDAQMLERIKRNEFLQSVENNTWEFPVNVFCEKYVQNFGKLNEKPQKEATFQRSKMLVETILTEHDIPQEYFARYTERRAVEQYLSTLWEMRQQELRRETEQKLSQKRQEESEFDAECTIYANYTGKEKTVHYCEQKVSEFINILRQCQKDSSSVIGNGERLYDISKQRESSWALHGGIADGIAGPGAGLAVAADVQRRNAAIQQQNAQLGATIGRISALTLESIHKKEVQATESLKVWQGKLERAKVLLSELLDEQELLDRISPSIKNTAVTETGAIKVKVELKPIQGLSIYGDVAAVVDGSIQVLIKENGKVVGTAICCLPFGGITNQCIVEGICRNAKRSNPSQKYQLAFAPNHLWAVEKM